MADTTPVGLRLPNDLLERIDAEVARATVARPHPPPTRTSVITELLTRQLDALDRDRTKKGARG